MLGMRNREAKQRTDYWLFDHESMLWMLIKHGILVAVVYETRMDVYRTLTPGTPITKAWPSEFFFDVHNAIRHCERLCQVTIGENEPWVTFDADSGRRCNTFHDERR